MRRGGRLILLLGVLIAAVVAIGVFVFLQGGTNSGSDVVLPPTIEPMRNVVAAQIDIPNNTLLSDGTLLTTVEIPESQYNASPNEYFTSPAEVANKVSLSSISATSPILASSVTDAGLSVRIPVAEEGQPRTKAISVQVNNLTGVADEITTGDFVDILSSFSISRVYLRPGFNEDGNVRFVEEQFTGFSTKTLIQNVQVLDVKRPEVAPAGTTPTPTAEGQQLDDSGQPIDSTGTTDAPVSQANSASLTPGSWLLVLAMTDQQAEILKFSREQGTGLTLVLRGRGDTATETTLGATLDLLISNFGLPEPQPEAPLQQNSTVSQGAQPTAAPVTPTPTATP